MEPGVLLADRYRLVRRLGEGGLATAFQVRDEALERDVCLKLLREGADEAALVREFDALVGLVHPSLARVHDYGVAVVAGSHRPFLTMDLVEGTPLAVFAEGRTFDDVRGAIVDVAHALALLHASGLRHGDVKPDNIVVEAGPKAVLLDLSCARRVGEAGDLVSGTVGYLAPEVMRGAPAHPSADLFALGVTLRALEKELAGGLPPDVATLVARLVDPEPARRPAEAAEVVDLLGAPPLATVRLARESRRSFGREAQLGALIEHVTGRPGRKARAVLVQGPRGVGTSRLLRELKWSVLRDMRVVEAFVHTRAPMASLFARCAGGDMHPDPRLAAVAACERLRNLGEPALILVDAADRLPAVDFEALLALLRLAGPDDPFTVVVGYAGARPVELEEIDLSRVELGPLDQQAVAGWLADIGSERSPRDLWAETGGIAADVAARLRGVSGAPIDVASASRDVAALAPSASRALALLIALDPMALENELFGMDVAIGDLAALQAAGLGVRRVGGWALARPAARAALEACVDVRAAHRELAAARLAALTEVETDEAAAATITAAAFRHLVSAGDTRRALALATTRSRDIDRAPAAWRTAAIAALERPIEPLEALQIAELLLRAGEPSRAREHAEAVIGRLADAEAIVRARLLAASCALEADDAPGVLAALERARKYLGATEARGIAAHLEARAKIRLGDHAAARLVAEPALALARDSALLADLHEDVGVAASFTGDHAIARVHLAMAAGLQRDLLAPRRLVRALSYQAIDAYRAGDPEGALQGYRQALAVAEEHGLAQQLARASLNFGTACHARGRLGEALDAYERGLRLATALGQHDLAVVLGFDLAKLYADAGAFDRATVRAKTCRDAAASREMTFFVAAADSVLADAALARGDAAEAIRIFSAAREGFELVGSTREAAEEDLELARAHLAAGTLDVSRRLVEKARNGGAIADAPDLQARAAVVAARLALATRELPTALSEAQIALRHARSSGQPDLEAEAKLVEADVLGGAGRTSEAEAATTAAREIWRTVASSLPEALREGFFRHPRRRDLRPQEAAQRTATRERRADKLESLITLFRKLNSSLETSHVLGLAMDAAIDLTNAERGFLVLRDPGGELRVPVARNIDREKVGKSHLKFSRGIAERAIENEEPVVTVDAQSDERFRENASVHAMKLRSVVAVPIRSPDGVLGALYVDNRFGRGRFEPDDVELLLTFADQVALALRNAALVSELRTRTRELEEERARIAGVARDQAAAIDRLTEEVKVRQEALEQRYDYGAIVGRSAALRRVFATLDRVVDSPLSVLVTGESGTGKELVARAVHFASRRKAAPFVGINCAALPSGLLESELFGHVRGAFSGADRDRVGLMVAARGGTLFLDELGEMPLEVQAKLLRVLQEREVRPLGSEVSTAVDFRLVCATNRDLRAQVRAGRFREDLFFRVSVVEVALPSLRERLEDLPMLSAHFLARAAEQLDRPVPRLSPAALRVLAAHPFPGNVRELENVLMRAAVFCERGEITPDDLGLNAQPERRVRRSYERGDYLAALERSGWNVVRAARELGVPRATFYRQLERFGLGGARANKRGSAADV